MRSKLFVPGSRPELFDKAMASAADGVSFDLEDAVEETQKVRARSELSHYLSRLPQGGQKTIVVRVNDRSSVHYRDDIAAVVRSSLDWLNIPKVESPSQVVEAAALLDEAERANGITRPIGILVNIESAAGLRRSHEIAAAHERVIGLQIGFGDLLTPLGMERDPHLLAHVRIQVRLAAGEAGIVAYDSAFVQVADKEGFRQDALAARALGFSGKSCIHPSQIADANEVFSPKQEEIDAALDLLTAAERATQGGVGAFMLNGHMVDLPFIRRAETVVAVARAYGMLTESKKAEQV